MGSEAQIWRVEKKITRDATRESHAQVGQRTTLCFGLGDKYTP